MLYGFDDDKSKVEFETMVVQDDEVWQVSNDNSVRTRRVMYTVPEGTTPIGVSVDVSDRYLSRYCCLGVVLGNPGEIIFVLQVYTGYSVQFTPQAKVFLVKTEL